MNIQEKLTQTLCNDKANENNMICLNAYGHGVIDALNKIDFENLVKALAKTCEYHEKNASGDKGDSGYYLAKKVLKQIESI